MSYNHKKIQYKETFKSKDGKERKENFNKKWISIITLGQKDKANY